MFIKILLLLNTCCNKQDDVIIRQSWPNNIEKAGVENYN